MGEKDVEAGVGDVGVCSDNIVVCGAIAEGTIIFLLILTDLLILPDFTRVSTFPDNDG